MGLYAQKTTVPVEQSRNEIERTLERYGASAFGYMTDTVSTTLAFKVNDRAIRIVMPKPGDGTSEKNAREERRRWRALLLIIKAKLDAIASGIATFENEFLPYTVMATGQTVGEWASPQLSRIRSGPVVLTLMEGSHDGKR